MNEGYFARPPAPFIYVFCQKVSINCQFMTALAVDNPRLTGFASINKRPE
jgi:hypothetical protein